MLNNRRKCNKTTYRGIYSEIITPISSSHLYTRHFAYTTQVSYGHASNTCDFFLCRSSENEMKMAAFSETFKTLYKLSYFVLMFPAGTL